MYTNTLSERLDQLQSGHFAADSMSMRLLFDCACLCVGVCVPMLELLSCFYCGLPSESFLVFSAAQREKSRSDAGRLELFVILELIMQKSPQTEMLF